MASLRRPADRLRRAFSGIWDRRAVAESVESSAILEPVPARLTGSPGEDGVRLPGSSPGGRVRVGLVVDSMGLGGLEEVVALLAQSLPQAGVDTAVACVRKGGVVARRRFRVDGPRPSRATWKELVFREKGSTPRALLVRDASSTTRRGP